MAHPSLQKNLIKVIGSLLSLALVACSSSSSTPSCDAWCQLAKTPNVNKVAWYNASAQVCAPTGGDPAPGCDFSWTGHKVSLGQDPNVGVLSNIQLVPGGDNSNDELIIPATATHPEVIIYEATAGNAPVNFKGWTVSFNGYYTYQQNNGYYDQWGNWWDNWQTVDGGGSLSLMSPDGVLYDVYGNALNFVGSESSTGGRDVLASAAEKEAASLTVISQGLQAKYGLDSDAGLNMAKVIAQDIKRPSNRGYTEAELDGMLGKMYNVKLGDMKKVSELAMSGDLGGARAKAQSLINTAAAANRTTPENMQRMLTDFYGSLLPTGATL